MTITKVSFGLCPARFQVFYTDDNGEEKYVYAFGMGTCYTCTDYMLKRFASEQKKHSVERREPLKGKSADIVIIDERRES